MPTKKDTPIMYCQTCGSLLPPGAKFCDQCGAGVPRPVPLSEQNDQGRPAFPPPPVIASGERSGRSTAGVVTIMIVAVLGLCLVMCVVLAVAQEVGPTIIERFDVTIPARPTRTPAP